MTNDAVMMICTFDRVNGCSRGLKPGSWYAPSLQQLPPPRMYAAGFDTTGVMLASHSYKAMMLLCCALYAQNVMGTGPA